MSQSSSTQPTDDTINFDFLYNDLPEAPPDLGVLGTANIYNPLAGSDSLGLTLPNGSVSTIFYWNRAIVRLTDSCSL